MMITLFFPSSRMGAVIEHVTHGEREALVKGNSICGRPASKDMNQQGG